jgi:hypothetical protein
MYGHQLTEHPIRILDDFRCQFAQPMVLGCRKYSEIDYISAILLTMTGTK